MVKVNPKIQKATFQIVLPEANSVTLMGDFNGWDHNANPMRKTRTGVWKTELKLKAGEYQFRYLVNEYEWVNDDEAPVVPNAFGTYNSLVKVEFPAARKTVKKAPAKKTTGSRNKPGKRQPKGKQG